MASKSNKLKNDTKNVVLTAMFLLEDDVTNQVAEVLAGAIASKVLSCVGNIIDHLLSALKFVAATSTSQAKITLTLKGISAQLESALLPHTQPPHPGTSWANIVASNPNPVPSLFNLSIPDQHTRMQQQLVYSAKTVLVDVDVSSVNAPQDHLLNGIFELHKKVNAYLVEIDSAMAVMAAIDGAVALLVKTSVWSITALDHGGYFFELNSAESACRFHSYSQDPN
ncbi:hypothetical protein E4T56_gene8390 [Termitomyces sp. T112]|nr:hypothetical protein E4T56_gene8390 [Termitomyces sp. T112]